MNQTPSPTTALQKALQLRGDDIAARVISGTADDARELAGYFEVLQKACSPTALQPIETAPRDGTHILMKVARREGWLVGRYASESDMFHVSIDTNFALPDSWLEGWYPLPPADFAQQLRIAEAAKQLVEADEAWATAPIDDDDDSLSAEYFEAFTALRTAVKEGNRD